MYIHLGYLKGQIRLRNPEIVNNNDNIGSMLKHHRLKLNLTLEEGAEGICSISYLSKIENSLIKPSPKYLELLEEKYDASFHDVETKHDELLYQLIENIFYNEQELLDGAHFFEDNYQSKLNKLGYMIGHQQFDQAGHKHQELNPYIKNFNNLELAFYIYLTAKLLTNEGRIKDAFSMLNIKTGNIKNIFLKTLIEVEKLILATKMHHHPYILMNYDDLTNQLIENEFYHMLQIVKFKYINYLVHFINQEQLDQILEKSKHLNLNERIYLESKFLYSNMHYIKAFELLKDHTHDQKSEQLLWMILNKLNMHKVLEQTLNQNTKIDDKHQQLIKSYLKLKTKQNTQLDTCISFIQSKVLKTNDLPDDVSQLYFWYEEGYQMFTKIGYYKDASILGHLILRKIRDLSTIFD